jgi:glucose 1-dehydrogenase
VLAINLKSAFFGRQLAAQQMIKQGVAASSTSLQCMRIWPMPGNTAYCLSKGGMRMLTRTAGVELAPYNILVVGVGPGGGGNPKQSVNHEGCGIDEETRRQYSATAYG